MVAAFPFLEIEVLSVTLKTRDSFFPVIVNVFAFWSTAEIIPWNGIGRVLCFAGEAAGDAAVFGEVEGELDVFGVVCALSSMGRATLAMQKMTAR